MKKTIAKIMAAANITIIQNAVDSVDAILTSFTLTFGTKKFFTKSCGRYIINKKQKQKFFEVVNFVATTRRWYDREVPREMRERRRPPKNFCLFLFSAVDSRSDRLKAFE